MILAIAALVLLLGAASVAVALAYTSDMAAARARVASGSHVARTPCGPIEYAMAGEGAPLLAVHGAGGGFDQAMEFAPALAGRGIHVIAMSRFGYLRTPLPRDASAEAQADAHACLLDALHIERAAILGVSAGAPSAMQFALRHPHRTAALVLLVPAAYAPRADGAPSVTPPSGTRLAFETALRSDFLMWAALRLAPRTLIRALLATPPERVDRASSAERARAARLLDIILPVTARRAGLVNDAAVTSTVPRYALERIAAPTLAIGVADDLFGTCDGARYTASQVPGARLLEYPAGGHVWIGHDEEVAAAIIAFVKAHAGARAPAG